MTKSTKPEMMLWLSDARGQYIPRDFANSFADRSKSVSGIPAEDWIILENGPDGQDNESYWDVWNEVCDSAVVTDEHGNKYTVWQDGNCWLVPEGMEWSDRDETYVWPHEEQS